MAYYRGDYYRQPSFRGDYYRGGGRGDPFWGALLKGIGTVAKGLLGIPNLPTATLASTPPLALAQQQMPPMPSLGPSGFGREQSAQKRPSPTIGPPDISQVHAFGGKRRRRMNPGNVKALRRSLRRVTSFAKLTQSVKKSIAHAATAAQVHHRRSQRALPPGQSFIEAVKVR